MSETLAKRLGYAGVVPFVGLSLGIIFTPGADSTGETLAAQVAAQMALLVYAAVILSFLGGIVWGRLLAADAGSIAVANRHLVYSVLPSLVAWFALFFGFERAALILASGFAAALLYDRSLAKAGLLPNWFYDMRIWLTLVVIVCLLSSVVFG